MLSALSVRKTGFLSLGGLLLLAGGILCWRLAGQTPPSPPPLLDETDESTTANNIDAFRERGREAGIAFRMRFLPAEQGTRFKINLYDHGCGIAIHDFDGDGHDDIYLCNQLGANALYRNKGDGTFEDVTEKAGVALGDRICVGAVFADYDNDGHVDLFVTSTRGGNVLFHNEGNGTFKDVTRQAGVHHIGHSQTASFFDYDNDGLLDLFVTNTASWTTNDYDTASHYYPGVPTFDALADSPREYNILYHNKGDGSFENVTESVGLKGQGWGGDVAVFDYNEDGRLDLLVTNMFGASQLYRNNDGKTFTDVTHTVLGRTSFGAIGSKVFDYNNDGRLDLLIVDMHSDMWLPTHYDPRKPGRLNLKKKYDHIMGPMYEREPAAEKSEKGLSSKFRVNYRAVIFGNTLFQKSSNGGFTEVSGQANLETFWPWGIATGDFNNDGYEDVFLPSGMGHPWGYWPNALMMNNGDGTFSDRARTCGIEPPPGGVYLDEILDGKRAPRSSRCAAVADFDGDGRVDLVVNNFNDRAFYFRNYFPQKNWIAFRLRGTRSNRDAIGAVVRLHIGSEVMVRQVQAAGGYLSQSSPAVHFGLGEHSEVDRVDIRWPSGHTQSLEHPRLNRLYPLVEKAEVAPH